MNPFAFSSFSDSDYPLLIIYLQDSPIFSFTIIYKVQLTCISFFLSLFIQEVRMNKSFNGFQMILCKCCRPIFLRGGRCQEQFWWPYHPHHQPSIMTTFAATITPLPTLPTHTSTNQHPTIPEHIAPLYPKTPVLLKPSVKCLFFFPLHEQQKTNIKTLITGLAIMMLNVRNLITEWKLVVWAKITSYHCINYYTMESGVKAKGSS